MAAAGIRREKVLIALNGIVFLLAAYALEDLHWTLYVFVAVALINFVSMALVHRPHLRIQAILHTLNMITAAIVAWQFHDQGRSGLAWMYIAATAGFLIAALRWWTRPVPLH